MPVRTSYAEWDGNLQQGKGTVKLGSGGFEGSYSFGSRFQESPGTNPEELLGAAHAACYSMALAAEISKAGFISRQIKTAARVTIQQVGQGPKITYIDLQTEVDAPELDEQKFQQLAEETKKNCPVSQALSCVPITLEARLMHRAIIL
jgi:lipoyl-dependent peroxiredoxin